MVLTRRHVECRAASKVGCDTVRSGQSKVSKLDSHSVVGDQNVLRLEIPVVDSNGVAVLDSVQNLKESTSGQKVITHELASLGDVGEEIAFRAEFDDDKGTIRGVHDAH